MTDDIRDLLAVEALGALPAEESARLSSEIARDPATARQLEDYRATVSLLEAGIARESASYDLLPGILAEIAVEAPRATPDRGGARWRRALPAFVVGAAASAAVFALALALGSDDTLGTPDAVAAVRGTPDFAGVHGEARVYGTDAPDGVLRLDLADVPAAPEGEHYEVWVLRPTSGEAMEAVGVFDPTSTEVSLELDLPGAGDYVAVDISLEPDAGPPEHSGTSLAGGEFEAST